MISELVNLFLVLAGAAVGAGGFMYWGMVLERGHHDCDPCPRRHRDDL